MSKFDRENKSETTLKYYDLFNKVIDLRLKNRLKFEDEERYTLSELDEIWKNATPEEIEEIHTIPRRWWFQYYEDGKPTPKSELDVYPYAEYFVQQKPILIDDVTKLKGKPYFGDKTFYNNDAYLYFMVDDPENSQIFIHSMSNRHYEELQNGYEFVNYSGLIPMFRRKK